MKKSTKFTLLASTILAFAISGNAVKADSSQLSKDGNYWYRDGKIVPVATPPAVPVAPSTTNQATPNKVPVATPPAVPVAPSTTNQATPNKVPVATPPAVPTVPSTTNQATPNKVPVATPPAVPVAPSTTNQATPNKVPVATPPAVPVAPSTTNQATPNKVPVATPPAVPTVPSTTNQATPNKVPVATPPAVPTVLSTTNQATPNKVPVATVKTKTVLTNGKNYQMLTSSPKMVSRATSEKTSIINTPVKGSALATLPVTGSKEGLEFSILGFLTLGLTSGFIGRKKYVSKHDRIK